MNSSILLIESLRYESLLLFTGSFTTLLYISTISWINVRFSSYIYICICWLCDSSVRFWPLTIESSESFWSWLMIRVSDYFLCRSVNQSLSEWNFQSWSVFTPLSFRNLGFHLSIRFWPRITHLSESFRLTFVPLSQQITVWLTESLPYCLSNQCLNQQIVKFCHDQDWLHCCLAV